MSPFAEPASMPAQPGQTSGWIARLTAGLCVAMVLAYPVRSLMLLAGVPVWVRAAWPVIAVAALRWPAASLCAFVVGAPLLPIVPQLAGWAPVSLGEAWLFALLAPAGVRVALGRRGWRAGLPAAFSLLLALATASLIVTIYPYRLAAEGTGSLLVELHAFLSGELAAASSQAHRFASIGAWVTLFDGLVLLWLILSEEVQDRSRFVRQLAASVAAGVTAVSVLGIAQWWTRWKLLPLWLQQDPNVVRINATFSDVNALGAFLVLSLWLPLACAALCNRWRCRWGWRLAAGAALAALIFSGSRSAWVALLVGAAVYIVGAWRSGLVRPPAALAAHGRALAAASLIALLLAGGALTTYATLADVRHGDQRGYFTRLLYTLNLHTSWDYRLRNRTAMWEAALKMTAAYPVCGIGIGRYYKEAWGYTTRRTAMIRPRENAHNYYLQVGAELGLSGLAAFLALLGWGAAAAFRGARAGDTAARQLSIACSAGIAAFAVTLIGGHALLLREGQLAFWPIVAIAVFAGRGPAVTPPTGERRRRRWRTWVPGALLAATAVSVPFRAAQAVARVDLTTTTWGVHGEEFDADGRGFNWTGDRAVLHVPASASAVAFELRSLAPMPQTVTLLVDDSVADTLVLRDHEWHVLRYLVPHRRGTGRFGRLEMRVTPAWRPPGDGRELGVILRGFRWEE